MHTQPMSELDGEFDNYRLSTAKCSKCNNQLHYTIWESSCGGYEDCKYECLKPKGCGHYYWIEGPDA